MFEVSVRDMKHSTTLGKMAKQQRLSCSADFDFWAICPRSQLYKMWDVRRLACVGTFMRCLALRPSMRKECKDRKKRLREQRHTDAEAGLHCNHPGCSIVAVNKAGLTNHRSQKSTLSQVAVCVFCAQSFGQYRLQSPVLLQKQTSCI